MHVLQAYLHFKTRCRGRNINFSRHIIHAPPYEDGMLDEARELITWMFYFPRVIAKIMLEPFAVRLHAFLTAISLHPCLMIVFIFDISICNWKICLCYYFCILFPAFVSVYRSLSAINAKMKTKEDGYVSNFFFKREFQIRTRISFTHRINSKRKLGVP